VVPRPVDFDLGADEIVAAAVDIFNEGGLDAVTMRSVSSRLGVSPIPLYNRVGNKDALVGAMADRLFADVAPPAADDERWDAYAARWARALRTRLQQTSDSRLILAPGRAAYVAASRSLVKTMRRDGLAADVAVQACRLLMWATVGFGAVASGATPPGAGRRSGPGRPGGDPTGLDDNEIDALFELQIGYLIDGIARHAAVEPLGQGHRPDGHR
jgi:TetR/AcrR family tetracycline transcriptional repressor